MDFNHCPHKDVKMWHFLCRLHDRHWSSSSVKDDSFIDPTYMNISIVIRVYYTTVIYFIFPFSPFSMTLIPGALSGAMISQTYTASLRHWLTCCSQRLASKADSQLPSSSSSSRTVTEPWKYRNSGKDVVLVTIGHIVLVCDQYNVTNQSIVITRIYACTSSSPQRSCHLTCA